MNTHDIECGMVPLGGGPCGDYPYHACAGQIEGHKGPHRCDCGYQWEEKKLPADGRRAAVRWVIRAAVLAFCVAGLLAHLAANSYKAEALAYQHALEEMGLSCSYDPKTPDVLGCRPMVAIPQNSSPSTPTSTQEDQ